MTKIHVRDNNIKIRDPEEITICKSKFFCTIPYKKKTFYALSHGLVCLVNLQIKISNQNYFVKSFVFPRAKTKYYMEYFKSEHSLKMSNIFYKYSFQSGGMASNLPI